MKKSENGKVFKPLLLAFLEEYENVLGDKFVSDNIDHLTLRYINKIEDTEMYPEIKKYFTDNLGLDISLNFGSDLTYINKLENTRIRQSYSLSSSNNSTLQYEVINYYGKY